MTLWSLVAGAAVTGVSLLLRPPPAMVARVRWGVQRTARRPSRSRAPRLVMLLGVLGGAALVIDLPAFLASLAAVGIAVFAWTRWTSERERAAVGRSRSEVAASLDLLAAEIRAGVVPRTALAGVAGDLVALAPVVAALDAGSEPVVALRVAARRAGAEALGDVAAAWSLAERSGVPLVRVLERLAVTVRDDVELSREVRAESAPARATGRLMALLPVLGLGLGAGLGSEPLVVLTRTVLGAGCLLLGAVLACVGAAWIDRVADAAERPA